MRNRRWKQRCAHLLACGEGNRQREAFRRELWACVVEAVRRRHAANLRIMDFIFGSGTSPWGPS